MKKIISLIFFVMSGCSNDYVTDDEVIQHFNEHSAVYDELAKQACSQFKDITDYKVIEITSSNTKYSDIANNLKILERDSIYIQRQNGKCRLQLIYFGEGTFNAVTIFSLNFNIQNPKLYDDKTDNFKVRKSLKRYYFDMPLSNGWYFSYQSE